MKITAQELNERTVKIIDHAIIECGRHRFCKAAGISESSYYKRRTGRKCSGWERFGRSTGWGNLQTIRFYPW